MKEISIIVPIYNEEKILTKNHSFFKELSQEGELIFVDGGSVDESVEIANTYGKVLFSRRGRATQMNYGAEYSQNDILLFLHVDAAISINTLKSIKQKIKNQGFVGGCLTQRIEKEGLVYRFIETFGNARAKIIKVFYGDQGIFARKDIFLKIGGFKDVPVMEDVLFTKRLRRLGETAVLPDNIQVSPRRWEKKGIVKTTFLYSFLNILFWLGVPLNRIKSYYDDLR